MEQEIYAKYKLWADAKIEALEIATAKRKDSIRTGRSSILKTHNDIARLGDKAAQLDAEIDKLQADKREAEEVRASEKNEFLALRQDYSESIDALGRALQVLRTQDHSYSQAMALLQQLAAKTGGMRRVLAILLQQAPQLGAPAVAAYSFQASGIVDVLESLLTKFKSELREIEEQEAKKDMDHQAEVEHLSRAVKDAVDDRDEHAAMKANEAVKVAAEQEKEDIIKADVAEDTKLKTDIITSFQIRTATYLKNQEIRKNEIKTVDEAAAILSSTEEGATSKHIELLQGPQKKVSFLQIGRKSHAKNGVSADRKEVLLYIRGRAQVLNSHVLEHVADELESNPFEKIIQMINALLEKLTMESSAEANHKEWCQEQLRNNAAKREQTTSQVTKLTAEMEELAATIAEISTQIAELSAEQVQLTKSLDEATSQRRQEHDKNEETISDAKAGVKAVKKASRVLQEFYSSQRLALQQRERTPPELDAYKGMQSLKSGVMGMLEVIENQFAHLLAEAKSSESQAAAMYQEFKAESMEAKITKHNAEIKLRRDRDQAEMQMGKLKKDTKSIQTELTEANKYSKLLKQSCLQVNVLYHDRAERREAEIAALNKVYQMLDNKQSE